MPLIKTLGSLGFAIFLIALLTVVLTASTILESVHGTPFAQENFYQAHWFDIFLSLVWVNIFCATLTRYPFKKKHIGYVITHLGILILLIGSLLTRLLGEEGQMTVFEDEAKNRMLQPGFTLRVSSPARGEETVDLEPKPISRNVSLPLSGLPFKIELTRIIPHALEVKSIEEDPELVPSNHALRAGISSEMLGFKEDLVLIENDPTKSGASSKTIGPATFVLKTETSAPTVKKTPTLRLFQENTGRSFELPVTGELTRAEWKETGLVISDLRYFKNARVENNELLDLENASHPNPAVEFEVSNDLGKREHHTRFSLFPEFNSLRGGRANNSFDLRVELDWPEDDDLPETQGPSFQFLVNEKNEWRTRVTSSKNGPSEPRPLKPGQPIQTGWMDMIVTVEKIFDHAKVSRNIKEDPQGSSGVPAVDLVILRKDGTPETRRLLLGRSLLIGEDKSSVRISSEPKAKELPFSLWLRDFRKVDYPGTSTPASFESDVTLRDSKNGVTLERAIRMNKPLDYQGYRVFQSSFIQDEALGEASVFTIAKNPGMPLIYGGAALSFIGVILLFYFHPFFNGNGYNEKPSKNDSLKAKRKK